MRAKLKDGRMVELAKECECHIHDDPHWWHTNGVWRRLNWKVYPAMQAIEEKLEQGKATRAEEDWYRSAARDISVAELERLAELRRNLERLGIVEIVR